MSATAATVALVPLFIDDRDGSRDLAGIEPAKSISELTRLDSGDCMIIGNGPGGAVVNVGVEVKSIWDLVSSAETGRLQATQVPAMLKTYDMSWLLYHGAYRIGADGYLWVRRKFGRPGDKHEYRPLKLGKRQVPYAYIEGLIYDFAFMGIHTRHVTDVREAAIWLHSLHRWWSKPWDKHRGMRVIDKSREVSLMPGMDEREMQRTRIAAQLPAVGFERAITAARHFPSVREMINAPVEEWTQVDGIGKVIARAIVEAVK